MGNSTRLITRTMKSFCALLALVAAASSSPLVPKLDSLEYGFCDGSPEPGSLTASVDPFPVVIATGETITISVSIDLAEEVPVGSQVSLKIKREGLIDIPAIIGDLLGSGTYYASATITTPDGATFACIY